VRVRHAGAVDGTKEDARARADREPLAAGRVCGSEREDNDTSEQRSHDHRAAYYRSRKEYDGLQVDQARRLKELETENAKLKRLVANLSLEKLVLKNIAEGNVWSVPVLQAQR